MIDVVFCKLIADRRTRKILACHVVGERAVEITQVAAVGIAAQMRVDDLAQVLSFPTYAGVLGRGKGYPSTQFEPELAGQLGQIMPKIIASKRRMQISLGQEEKSVV